MTAPAALRLHSWRSATVLSHSGSVERCTLPLGGGRLEAWPFNPRNAVGPFKHHVPEAFVIEQW